MLAGNSTRDYTLDLLYNTSPETLQSIKNSLAKIDHESKEATESGAKAESLKSLLGGDGLVNLYNSMKEGKLNDGWTTGLNGGEIQTPYLRRSKKALEDMDALSRMYSKDNAQPFEKMEKALKEYTNQFGQASKKEKQEQEEQMQSRVDTCSDENNKYGAESSEKDVDPKFKIVANWLKTLNTTNNKKKVFRQMEKMSDVQKVSAIEFAKPKMLFMKKLVSKDFWFRGEAKADRFLHCITDFSGSMGEYKSNRNTAWQLLFDKCKELGISIENTLFNEDLNEETLQKWNSQADLNKAFKMRPDGEDNLGRATISKLKLLTKKKEKQYLVAISDGTGSFKDKVQSDRALELAKEKNVEVKYILFSNQNQMQSTPKEDIFYIY